jgi:hypothetical protein
VVGCIKEKKQMGKIDYAMKLLETLDGTKTLPESTLIIASGQVLALLAIAEQMERANDLKEKEFVK